MAYNMDYSRQYRDKPEKDLSKVSTYGLIKSFTKKDGNILDIACGTGYLLDFLGGGTGVDIDPKLIEECKRRYPQNTFLVSNCYNIPLKDESFDTLVMCMIIEHLTEPERALTEARRLLVSGGNLIIVTPRRNDLFYKIFVKKDPTHVREYTTKELKNLVSKYFKLKNTAYGTVSTKIPGFMTKIIKSDIIINCVK